MDGICDISCLGSNEYTCYQATIYVPDDEYQGLELECGGENEGCGSIGPYIQCDGTTNITALEYEESRWRCDDFDCCPLPQETISCEAGTDCQVKNLLLSGD